VGVEPARDLYAGNNVDNLRRLSAVGWVAGLLVVLGIVPFQPPTAAIGAWGWVAVSAILATTGATLWWLVRHPHRATVGVLLVTSYLATLSLGADQWLSGGYRAPYHEVLMLLVLVGALGHPWQRFLPLGGVIAVVALLPLAYGGDTAMLLTIVVKLVLWSGMAAFCLVLMSRVRAQRVATERLAHVDALTLLANRRAFEAEARAALGEPLALAVGDLDAFKDINDSFGHLAGDACLSEVAAALTAQARAGDSVFRWGGDEFAVLLRGAGAQEAAVACARLQVAVAETVRRPDGGRVTMTIGWALHEPGTDLEALMAAADADLLARKVTRRAVAAAA
jgi:diguanylate cyclase (GGDEF)-like protein